MEAQWQADRSALRDLLQTRPDLTLKEMAKRVGRSYGWAKKWASANRKTRNRPQRRHLLISPGMSPKLSEELKLAEERNKHLVARLAVVEANAARLGVDPEELYRSVMKPVRTHSYAGAPEVRRTKRL